MQVMQGMDHLFPPPLTRGVPKRSGVPVKILGVTPGGSRSVCVCVCMCPGAGQCQCREFSYAPQRLRLGYCGTGTDLM